MEQAVMIGLVSVLFCFNVWLIGANESIKNQNETLKNLNNNLNKDLEELKSKNSSLWHETLELKEHIESYKFPVGSKVKWLDRTGEEEFGIVYDDYEILDKHYVVIKRLKGDKLIGSPLSIKAEKLTVL
ncbi:MAG: hypothetical protein ACRCW1_03200 [Anaerotignaceae bacterium]